MVGGGLVSACKYACGRVFSAADEQEQCVCVCVCVCVCGSLFPVRLCGSVEVKSIRQAGRQALLWAY